MIPNHQYISLVVPPADKIPLAIVCIAVAVVVAYLAVRYIKNRGA